MDNIQVLGNFKKLLNNVQPIDLEWYYVCMYLCAHLHMGVCAHVCSCVSYVYVYIHINVCIEIEISINMQIYAYYICIYNKIHELKSSN